MAVRFPSPRGWAMGFLLLSAVTTIPAPAGAEAIGGLEFFGDSNSDDGNAWRISGKVFPASPPYREGRFGNGPVWAEMFRDRLGIPPGRYANHAVGGAYTGQGNLVSDVAPGTRLGDAMRNTGMLAQVDAYVDAGNRPAPDTLVVIWAGDNDYAAVNGVAPQAVERAVANIDQAVRRLADAGATRFLVANVNEDLVFPGARATNSQEWNRANAADHNIRLAALI